MKVVEATRPGGADMLVAGSRAMPAPGPGEVLIRVAASGVNGPDIAQREGRYPAPKGASELLGLEVSGEIAARGAGADRWRIGDQVCALTNGGGYAEFVAVPEDHCMAIPAGVDLIDAAGLPETFMTVWSNVFFGQDVPRGANFLIEGGAGGIGSAAVQLGAAMGLVVFATAGGRADCDFVESLGARRAIDYRTEDFVPILRDAGGADVILDSLGGDAVARHIKAARHDGRIISIAFNHGSRIEIDLMPMMLKRLTLTGSTLRSRPNSFKAGLARDLEARVWPFFGAGPMRTVTHAVFPLSAAADAHRMMEAGAHRGKILLCP